MFDFAAQYEAVQRRDPAMDGILFVAQDDGNLLPPRLHGAYPASAATAERAGYRPCLRCPPETAPFCPAWKDTKTTVERALALIEAGALDRDTVDALAESLGIGPRYLSRLFAEHLDASPLQVAQSVRIQRAKRLLDDTDFPIAVTAEHAGFSSPQRVSAAFARLYRQPPSTLRGRQTIGESKSKIRVELPPIFEKSTTCNKRSGF